jgi:hypothetical protein
MKTVKKILYATMAIGWAFLSCPIVEAQTRSAVRPPSVSATVTSPKPASSNVTSRPVVPTAKSSTSPQPSTVSQKFSKPTVTQTPSARIHGNSLYSNKPQHLYGIFGTNTNTGKTTLHKYGVGGGTTKSGSQLAPTSQRGTLAPNRDYSNRGLDQVNKLNKQAQAKGEPVKYSTRNLQRIPSQPASGSQSTRQSILFKEQQAVTKHAISRGSAPEGNSLPKPSQFSRVNK